MYVDHLNFPAYPVMAVVQLARELSLCLTIWTLCHENTWGRGCIDLDFLNLGSTWSWVVNFMPHPL